MINVSGLSKTFQNIRAVDNVSFQVSKGEIVGFLGPNGAGKTTTMRALTGFIPPTGGKILIDGIDVSEEPLRTKRKIGYMPEVPPLYPELTVEAYLKYVSDLKSLSGPKSNKEIDRVIDMISLGPVRNRLIGNISKGFRQRTGLAQALLGNPEFLILDEPTVGLDPAQIHDVRDLIKGLAQEHTVILSTHILAEVEITCKRVIVIDRGRIVANDSIDKIMSSAAGASSLLVRVDNPGDIQEKLRGLQGVEDVSVDRQRDNAYLVHGLITDDLKREISRLTVEGGYGLLALSDVIRKLEDVFMKLTESHTAAAVEPKQIEDKEPSEQKAPEEAESTEEAAGNGGDETETKEE